MSRRAGIWIAGRLSGRLNAITSHPLIATTVGGVVAGLLLGWITTGGAASDNQDKGAGAPCTPVAELRGSGIAAHAISATSDGSLPHFSGQIGGGNFLRVSPVGARDFRNSMKVAPGTRIRVGLRLDNPGPGEVGEVQVKVALPENAAPVLHLRATIRFNGIAGIQQVQDGAVIYVNGARNACARYVPGSSAEGRRRRDNSLWRASLAGEDHIVSAHGLNRGNLRATRYPEAEYLYFDVVVI